MKRLISLLMCAVLTATPVYAGAAASDKPDPDSRIHELLEAAAENISSTVSKAKKKASSIADHALEAMDDAANMVVDEAGEVVNMATESAGKVSSAASEALDQICEKGEDLIAAAGSAVEGLDLTKAENADKARKAIDIAVEKVCSGLIGKKLDLETIRIIKDLVFGAVVYGYQYTHGSITLPEYAALMSEIIIKEGLPVGIGYIAGKLPIPGAGQIAKEAAEYLIQSAYGEN